MCECTTNTAKGDEKIFSVNDNSTKIHTKHFRRGLLNHPVITSSGKELQKSNFFDWNSSKLAHNRKQSYYC